MTTKKTVNGTHGNRIGRAGLGLLLTLMLAGCANRPNRAPVEERIATSKSAAAAVSVAAAASSNGAEAVKPPALPETGPKPGYYIVKPGDTLIRIGLENGQNWKDLVKWNALENPNIIEVGQQLRVLPPGIDPGAATSRPVAVAKVETRALVTAPGVPSAAGAIPATPAASVPQAATAPPASRHPAPRPATTTCAGPGRRTAAWWRRSKKARSRAS